MRNEVIDIMIEYTTKTIEGVNFISDTKFVEPFEYRNGIRVEMVSGRLLNRSPEMAGVLLMMGLRKVGIDPCYDAEIYAHYPLGYYIYRATHYLLNGYWWGIRFLYKNARVFQQIPDTECFSWRYFTPYTWFKKLHNRA